MTYLSSNVDLSLISSEEAPIINSNSPASKTLFISRFQKANISLLIMNETVFVFPASKEILWNPFNSLTGRVTELTLSLM